MTRVRQLVRALRRLPYGLAVEKRWQVASAQLRPGDGSIIERFPPPSEWNPIRCPREYRFIVDPFPHPEGGVLVEALGKWDQRGEIVHLQDGHCSVVCDGACHYSYPVTTHCGDSVFLLPEIGDWSPPRLFRLSARGATPDVFLDIDGLQRLLDVTPYVAPNGLTYLFANHLREEDRVLRLWVGPSITGRFIEHPASPILNSQRGSRMAGHLLQRDGKLYRLGQDNSRAYGDGILLFEILEISARVYREVERGRLKFSGLRGPHTLNLVGDTAYFDFYRDRLSPFIAVRRLRSRLAKWSSRERRSR